MKKSNQLIALYFLIGFITSLALSFLVAIKCENFFPYSFVFCFPFLYCLAFNSRHSLRLIVSSLFVSLFVSFPFLGLNWQMPVELNLQTTSFLILFQVFFYAAHCFHAVIHQSSSFQLKYSDLFEIVWNSLPMIIIALAFSAAGHGLIVMTAVMFQSININFLYSIIDYTPYFLMISSITLFFSGLAIAELNQEVVYNIRFIIFRVVYYLLPCLAAITVAYFVLYWIQFLIGQELSFYPVGILLLLTGAGIVLINGWYQDGSQIIEYPTVVSYLLKVYRIVLFFISLMLIFEVFRWVDVFPNLLLLLTLMGLFSFAYAITALMKAPRERKKIGDYNIYISLFFLMVFFIINNPFYPIPYYQQQIPIPEDFIKENISNIQLLQTDEQ